MVDLEQEDFPFGEEGFDNLPVNPYELVIAASKKAREINNKVQKYISPEIKIKPMSITMKKLLDKDIQFEYVEKKKEDQPLSIQTEV